MKKIFKFAVLSIFFIKTGLASECSFKKNIRNFTPDGTLSSQVIVDYPETFNDSHDPMSLPLIRNLSKICKTSECHLEVKLNKEVIKKAKYEFDSKSNYFKPSVPNAIVNLEGKKINNQTLIFEVKNKGILQCSHVINITLRD